MSNRLHRTWPCGAQESVEVEGPFVSLKDEREKLRPCFHHGLYCHRGAKGPREDLIPLVEA